MKKISKKELLKEYPTIKDIDKIKEPIFRIRKYKTKTPPLVELEIAWRKLKASGFFDI